MISEAVAKAIEAASLPAPAPPPPTPIRPLRIRKPLPRTFGRWLVVGSAMWDADRDRATVRVECECGRVTKSVDLRDLRGGKSTQCRKCRNNQARPRKRATT